MRYAIPSKQIDFIIEHFFQFSFGHPEGFLPNKEDFLKLTHPADLHYLAMIYNWDDGHTVLEWILDSPLCTRSTANLLFWRSAPDYYLKCDLEDDNSCESCNYGGYAVIKKVIQKYQTNSFSQYQIEFDPSGELEDMNSENPKWKVPAGVYDKIEGIQIEEG